MLLSAPIRQSPTICPSSLIAAAEDCVAVLGRNWLRSVTVPFARSHASANSRPLVSNALPTTRLPRRSLADDPCTFHVAGIIACRSVAAPLFRSHRYAWLVLPACRANPTARPAFTWLVVLYSKPF